MAGGLGRDGLEVVDRVGPVIEREGGDLAPPTSASTASGSSQPGTLDSSTRWSPGSRPPAEALETCQGPPPARQRAPAAMASAGTIATWRLPASQASDWARAPRAARHDARTRPRTGP
ncbi:MAG: hypothetical protein HY721_00515 [Planctomycetes bacterium]|nr:hypothetical protein [Planctomycetota bacterium]